MSRQDMRPGLRAASGDEKPPPQPAPEQEPHPTPSTPWPNPGPVRTGGPGIAPDLDLDDERWHDANPGSYPGARVIARDPSRAIYTVALTRCDCGAVTGECDCAYLANTVVFAPVLTLRGTR